MQVDKNPYLSPRPIDKPEVPDWRPVEKLGAVVSIRNEISVAAVSLLLALSYSMFFCWLAGLFVSGAVRFWIVSFLFGGMFVFVRYLFVREMKSAAITICVEGLVFSAASELRVSWHEINRWTQRRSGIITLHTNKGRMTIGHWAANKQNNKVICQYLVARIGDLSV